jgi:sulfite exporter TauE/SafE
MCGGIVGAFSVAAPPAKAFPIAVVTQTRSLAFTPEGSLRILAFNLGRITSYMIAGAVAGLLGSVPALIHITALQSIGYWLANVLLIALGLTLMNLWHGLARVESLGLWMWRRVQPLIRRFLPVETMWQAAALGSLWGWVPCGMVYSVLMTALLTGSALNGALVMLAFGLGTLPNLLLISKFSAALTQFGQYLWVRYLAASLLLIAGSFGLYRAWVLPEALLKGGFCIS